MAIEELPEQADAPIARPMVLLLSISSEPWFDESYSVLMDKLSRRTQLKRASTASAAIRFLSNVNAGAEEFKLRAIFVTDPGLTESDSDYGQEQLQELLHGMLEYLTNGGTVIFCCLFSGFISPPDLDRFFGQSFNLRWRFGNYERTTVHLNRNHSDKDIFNNVSYLPAEYSQKAVFLRYVDPAAAVYRPHDDSPIDEQTPVAFTAFGRGWLGYIGDVNREEGSDSALLAMCRLF